MLAEDLIRLIEKIKETKSEDNHIEIKKAYSGFPKIYDTLSSFSNQSGGGIIIFGIDQDNDYDLCGVYDADDLQKKLTAICNQMSPKVRPLCTVAGIDGKTFVSAEIQEMDVYDKPCFYYGAGRMKGSYIRIGDSDEHMTEYEIYSYEAFKKKIQDEIRTESRADIKDIQTDSFDYYLGQLKRVKPKQANLPVDRIMKLQGFIDGEKPTLAGLLMFADYPQAFYPQLCITAVSVQGYEIGDLGNLSQRFDDNERIEGTIPQMLDAAMDFVKRNIKVRTIIDEKTGKREDRPEYPIIAIREIILNALIHRDYSIHTDLSPITIRVFKDRIEFENPGGLYGSMTIDKLGKATADTRNPFIAKTMEVMGETENRYSGIPLIKRLMSEYGLPEPLFENTRGVFRVTLYNDSHKTENEGELPLVQEILQFCNDWRSREELAERFSGLSTPYLMSAYIKPLVQSGRLVLFNTEKPKSKNQKYRTK
ncbi:MAG: putative DNA binding domain-containing protein [Clostridiales bacterium]|nr:putative DNA binding domain-containing protein [Clostridiales bacterium]